MKKKKLILSQSYDVEVYGISSALQPYRLCWFLGQSLDLDFQMLDNIKLPAAKQAYFICYQSLNQSTEQCFLIKNENNGLYYLPKLKIADFFLIKMVDQNLHPVENLKTRIQSIAQIQTVFTIDLSKPKAAEPFIIEL